MEIKDIFIRLGFPKHTDRLYVELQKTRKPLSVSALSSNVGVSRVVVYRCIDALLQKDLITKTIIGKRLFYMAASPSKLKALIKITETETSAVIKKQEGMRSKDVPHSVRFLYGAVGIRAAFDDVISHTQKGETFLRYTSEQDLTKVNSYLARDYRERRDKKKLERLVISNAVSGTRKNSRLERFVKFIPEEADQFQQNIIQLVYGNRMSIIDLTREEVTIIENKQLADFQKTIFQLLYKQLDRR